MCIVCFVKSGFAMFACQKIGYSVLRHAKSPILLSLQVINYDKKLTGRDPYQLYQKELHLKKRYLNG